MYPRTWLEAGEYGEPSLLSSMMEIILLVTTLLLSTVNLEMTKSGYAFPSSGPDMAQSDSGSRRAPHSPVPCPGCTPPVSEKETAALR